MGQTLQLKHARIERVEAVINAGHDRDCYVKVTAPMTRGLMRLMNAEYISNDGREKSIDFDYGLEKIRFQLTPAAGMENRHLSVECRSADHFKAIRKKDKLRGRITRVQFRLDVIADPRAILDYVFNIGGPEGMATLEPMQGELFTIAKQTIPPARPKADRGEEKSDGAGGEKSDQSTGRILPARADGKMAAAGRDDEPPAWVTSTKKVQ